MKIEMYVVMTGKGMILGPFKTADDAAAFLTKNYSQLAGHSRIECVWSLSLWDDLPVEKAA